MGHILVVSEYDESTNKYTLKNSWGISVDTVPGSHFKGPHYQLDHAVNEEDYVTITLNDPIKGIFYMSTYPWEQLFIQAGYHPYQPFRTHTVKPSRKSARKVGNVRVSTRSVSQRKTPSRSTRSLTRTYSPAQTRKLPSLN